MSFLLGSNIGTLADTHVHGRVGRAGGTVDQVLSYQGCDVEDINIPDGGFGAVVHPGRLKTLRRHLKQEAKYLIHGPRIPRDRKTIVLDMHDASTRPELRQRYDCSISSNLLEHSPNPVRLLLNFFFVTKPGGWQFHTLPHYQYTYDRFRQPTPVEHMLEDFERDMGFDDTTHTEDYRLSAVEKDGWQREFHTRYPLTYPFIHFHVFDEHNTRALFERVFTDVTSDILKTERFSDNVVLFRNALNPEFKRRYPRQIAAFEA